MNPALLRIGRRHLRRHRLQSLLLVLGVALGVAVVVAVDLANASARRSFRLATDSLTGRATHQVVGGPAGLDEDLYRRLKVDHGLRDIAPVVEDYVTAVELDRRPMRLLGVDPFAEAPFRDYVAQQDEAVPLETLTALLTEPGAILLSREVAERHGLRPGDTLTLEYGAELHPTRIVALLEPGDELARRALTGLLIADIGTAQELLDQVGRLSHIDLILDDTSPTAEQVQALLPGGLRLERASTRTATTEQMSRAFEINLFAMSLLAVVVGIYLIYNTVTFSVVQRRPTLGTLRSLGVTRGEIFAMVVIETAALGGLGVLVGLLLGTVLGRGLVGLVTRTINDLYFTLTVTGFDLSAWSLVKGAAIGLGASVLAALVPAWEATRVAPAGVLRRSELESRIGRLLPWVTVGGLLLGLLGGLLLLLPLRRLEISFAGLFAVLLGLSLLIPATTLVVMRLAAPVTGRLGGVVGRLAPRSIGRSLSRTAVAIAALMIAVATIVGVSIMVGSFRQTVADWLDATLQADIFITTPGNSVGRSDGFAGELVGEVGAVPGVAETVTARNLQLETPRYGLVHLVALSRDIAGGRRFVWTDGPADSLWGKVEQGAVLVSQPFAYRHRIARQPGTVVELPTDSGPHRFPVVGIYHDYASERGIVLLADSVYRRYWDDPLYSSVAALVEPGRDVDAMVALLQARFAGRHQLVIQSNRGLREGALEVFDRTFAITGVLQLLAVIVAFIGVFSTLMALQLERTREVGVLRATGMTVRQLWRMVLLETGLMGLSAGALALPAGTLLAVILIYVINLRSFGWLLDFRPQPGDYLWALLVAVVSALLAGLYPAARFGRIQAAEAMRLD